MSHLDDMTPQEQQMFADIEDPPTRRAERDDAKSLSAIVSLLESNRRLRRERDDALDELHQEHIGRQQAADELMRLKDHDSHGPTPTQDGPR